jgi:epoxyqueuosine reductase
MVLEERIKEQAHTLGFELVGIAPATEADGFDRLRDWLGHGHAGEMTYLHRHAEARRHPSSVLPKVRSVIMVGMNYQATPSSCPLPASGRGSKTEEQEKKPPGVGRQRQTVLAPPLRVGEGAGGVGFFPLAPPLRVGEGAGGVGFPGRIARYAWGSADYHDVLRARLNALLAWVQGEVPRCTGRGVVDTAPLLERDFARRAGLGWFGKNTMLLNKRLGSYFFLGALLLDIQLKADEPHHSAHCGTCTACLDACPTRAFPEPGTLDARRCISYLTIELRGPVPEELRPGLGDWLFGCDICQEVCPWNRKAPETREEAFRPRADLAPVDLIELLGLSEEEFRHRFRGTALTRAKRRGLLRNAALVLGNQGDRAALPALRRALEDPEPLVREAALWAIDHILENGYDTEPMNKNVSL